MNKKPFYFLAIFMGLMLGYHLGVIGPTLPWIKHQMQLSSWQQAHATSSYLIGLFLGALFTSLLSSYLKRKGELYFILLSFILVCLLGLKLESFYLLLVYRMLSGFLCGIIGAAVPMILVENGGIEKKASLTFTFQIAIATGVGLSYLLGFIFIKQETFNLLFFAPILLVLICLVVTYKINISKNPKKTDGFLFKEYKKSYFVALGLNFFQQACGINAITFFIQSILSSRFNSNLSSAYFIPMMISLVSLSTTSLVLLRIDILKRRFLLMTGSIGMALGLFTLSYNQSISAIFIFIISFALSFGPLVYLVMNEVFPDSIRAKGASLSFFVNCFTNYIVSLVFLPLSFKFGIEVMWAAFGILSFLSFMFVKLFVPETLHKSNQAIVRQLNHKG